MGKAGTAMCRLDIAASCTIMHYACMHVSLWLLLTLVLNSLLQLLNSIRHVNTGIAGVDSSGTHSSSLV